MIRNTDGLAGRPVPAVGCTGSPARVLQIGPNIKKEPAMNSRFRISCVAALAAGITLAAAGCTG
ncbi:MAG: hypothetical protein M3017_11835, partial [Actinomycetota bacterium]|nr:hypothetical protein [Actinomycetota bacterium]